MTRAARRLAAWLVLGSTATALGFVACSFPEVDFAEGASAEEGGVEAATGEAAVDRGVAEGDGALAQPINHDVDPEGGAQDATTAGDAAQVDATGCTTCDCDGDGFNRVEPSAGCNGGPGGKQPDCDDLNAAIHPGLGFIFDPWPASSSHRPEGDWDCDGTTIKQLPYDGACTSLSACATGFVGNPPCGGTGDYLTCNKEVLPIFGLTCSEKAREAPGKRTQSCH